MGSWIQRPEIAASKEFVTRPGREQLIVSGFVPTAGFIATRLCRPCSAHSDDDDVEKLSICPWRATFCDEFFSRRNYLTIERLYGSQVTARNITLGQFASLPEACVNVDTITAFQTQLHHAPWAVCTPPIVVIRESGLTIIVLELEDLFFIDLFLTPLQH